LPVSLILAILPLHIFLEHLLTTGKTASFESQLFKGHWLYTKGSSSIFQLNSVSFEESSFNPIISSFTTAQGDSSVELRHMRSLNVIPEFVAEVE